MANELNSNKKTMSSLEIAELAGRNHKDVMRSIRDMEPAWVKVNGRNFALVEYKDTKGKLVLVMNYITMSACMSLPNSMMKQGQN
jgi:phage regulator Rha-like protein